MNNPDLRNYFSVTELKNLMPGAIGVEPVLAATVQHALDGEGSFSRANLTLSIGKILGLEEEYSEKLGASVELFHLASLVLDDLPCMDDATVRRSRPCAHVVYGESSSILASLGFINRAYRLLWDSFSRSPLDRQREAAALVEQCLGLSGILDGQAKDIRFSHGNQSASDVLEVAQKKTGSLLRLCLLLPAVLAGADRHTRMYLSRIADLWGLAYQILDDLKDLFFGEGLSGKTAQRDQVLGRPNLALAIGEEAAMETLDRIIDQTEYDLNQLGRDNPELNEALSGFHQKITSSIKQLMEAHVAA